MRWAWESADSLWHVELVEAEGRLRWHGEDKPRPGVRGADLAGVEREQSVEDLLRSGRGAYPCPDEIMAALLAAAARCSHGVAPRR